MDFLDEALTLSPKNALCRYHKAQLLFTDEKYDDALAEINDLKQIAPKEPLVYFLAGKVKFETKIFWLKLVGKIQLFCRFIKRWVNRI